MCRTRSQRSANLGTKAYAFSTWCLTWPSTDGEAAQGAPVRLDANRRLPGREIKARGTVDANNSWWVSDLLAADCKKKRGSTQLGTTKGSSDTVCCMR